jgi:hypothetical protein
MSHNYTYEGVIHFLYQEFQKIENERQEWELEKQELKVYNFVIIRGKSNN